MRDLRLLNVYRRHDANVVRHFGWSGDETCGVFDVPSPIDKAPMLVIASCGGGWDHVSVSRVNRTPNWPEMDYVKRLFFEATETVVQFHVPDSDHISEHPFCLHLWRPQGAEMPRPPAFMVGGRSKEQALREFDEYEASR